jgi:hypothetical protein
VGSSGHADRAAGRRQALTWPAMQTVELVVVVDMHDRCTSESMDAVLSSIAATTSADRKIVVVDRSYGHARWSVAERHVDTERFEPPEEYGDLAYLALASAFAAQLQGTLFDMLLCVTGDRPLSGSQLDVAARRCFSEDPDLGMLPVSGGPPRSVRRALTRQILDPRAVRGDPRCSLGLLRSVARASAHGYRYGEALPGDAWWFAETAVKALAARGYLPWRSVGRSGLSPSALFPLTLRACGYRSSPVPHPHGGDVRNARTSELDGRPAS